MGKQKKSLVCMYVDNFCGIEKESFNFNMKRRYMINDGVISRKASEEIADFPTDFWGKNVSALTLLIGENGAGKTTLMRLLIKWLCQLSVGHIPQEKGALVISVGDEDRLIAFDGGELWSEIRSDESIECIKGTDEIKELLSDIRLAYYTDTMTDLELGDLLTPEELKFLQDDSLLTRLSKSMEDRYQFDSVKDCIKREDFRRQMELFLQINSQNNKNLGIKMEFPIRYMKLTAIKAGDKEGFKEIQDDYDSLIGMAMDLWNKVFADDADNELPDIARDLLWGLFSGTIVSLLCWEKTLPYEKGSIVVKKVGESLRAYNSTVYNDWNTVIKHFLKNVFGDCEEAFDVAQRKNVFCTAWKKQTVNDIETFLDVLNDMKNGELLDKWKLSETGQNAREFRLEHFYEKDEKNKEDENRHLSLMQQWKDLWKHYLTVAHLMPKCRFDWCYPSSGEANKANLCRTMCVDDMADCKHVWFLLDEPDNTFHPDWKRKTIHELLESCSFYKISFQLMISTHSPIMLSDVPKQAMVLLRSGGKKVSSDKSHNEEEKYQVFADSSPFGQQIYTLFQDAFFMEHGVIGSFADRKISEIYKFLVRFGRYLRRDSIKATELGKYKEKLKNIKYIINFIDEPLLKGHLLQNYNWCSKLSDERQSTAEL